MSKSSEKRGQADQYLQQAIAIMETPGDIPGEELEKRVHLEELADRLYKDAADLEELEKKLNDAKGGLPQAPRGTSAVSQPFETWGHFLTAVWMSKNRNVKDERLSYFKDEGGPQEKKDLAEGVGSTGGYLVFPDIRTQLYALMAEASLVRPGATIIPMSSRTVRMPALKQDDTTAGVPHWFGGMQAFWTEEAALKDSTNPQFRQIELVAHKMAALTYASDELLQDSAISLEAFLSGPMGFSGVVTWMEDYAFLRGTGAGQPQGVVNADCTIAVARHSTVPAVQYVDLVKMYQNFLPSAKGTWTITQSLISDLMTMQDPAGHYLWPTLFLGGAAADRPGSLIGMPVRFTEKLPASGSNGDVLLADWQYYLIGDRQAITVDSSIHAQFVRDQTVWRVVHRVDGQPWLNAPVTLADGVNEVSPFVILGAKAS